MTARINDDRIAVAHQDVTERGFADAIELDDVRKGGGGRQSAGDVDGLPGGHSADDGIGLVAALAQKRRRLLAGVTVTADDRDRSRRVKPKRSDVRHREQFRVRLRVKIELGPQRDMSAVDLVGGANVEHLERLPAIEPLGELLRRQLRQ